MEKIKKKNDGERKEKDGRWRKKRERTKEEDDGNRVFILDFHVDFLIHVSYTPHGNRVFKTRFAIVKSSLTNSSC